MDSNKGHSAFWKPGSLIGEHGLVRWDEFDGMKGLAAILVVLAHNWIITTEYNFIYRQLYFSPIVVIFLIMPFLFAPKPVATDTILNSITRLLVPYVFFLTLYSLLYWLVFASERTWVDQLSVYLAALFVANGDFINRASGLGLLWFLPTMLSAKLLHMWFYGLSAATRSWLFPLWLGVFMIIGLTGGKSLVAVKIHDYIPFGLDIAVYCLPIGVVVAYLLSKINRSEKSLQLGLALLVVYVLLAIVSTVVEKGYGLPGMRVTTIFEPVSFAVHTSRIVLGCLVLVLIAPLLGKVALLRAAGSGNNGLVMYAVHQPVFMVMYTLAERAGIKTSGLGLGIASFVLTVLITLGIARILLRFSTLRHFVMPTSYEQWVSVWRRPK